MHSSVVVTPAAVPFGLKSIKFWNPGQFKGCNALKPKINPTRVRIKKKESSRWLENVRQSTVLMNRPADYVHIGDRESDIYELFCLIQYLGSWFVVRTCVDRLAGEGSDTVARKMAKAPVKGKHRVEGRTKTGEEYTALLQIKYEIFRARPPLGKQKDHPTLEPMVIYALEERTPRGRERIHWKLLTNLPVDSMEAAMES